MKIACGLPPNFEEIAASLPGARNPRAIFCYGDTIYVPGGQALSEPLLAHEAVHSARQGTTDAEVRSWWAEYIREPIFRLYEEMPAHRAEYVAACKMTRDRNARHHYLVEIARRLSGPLYGNLIGLRAAKAVICPN